MPLYEYRCPACRNLFEQLRRFSESDRPAQCPSCKEEQAQRVMSAPSLQGQGKEGSASSGCTPRSGFT